MFFQRKRSAGEGREAEIRQEVKQAQNRQRSVPTEIQEEDGTVRGEWCVCEQTDVSRGVETVDAQSSHSQPGLMG